MAVRRKHDVAIIVVLAVCAAAYASLRSELRLRHDMPAEFFDASQVAPERRAKEEIVARAYWTCAVNEIQWRYGYGNRLPEEPPREFAVTVAEVGPAARDEAMRRVEWQRLRQVWNVSEVWSVHYELSFGSLRTSVHAAGNWWDGIFHSLTGH